MKIQRRKLSLSHCSIAPRRPARDWLLRHSDECPSRTYQRRPPECPTRASRARASRSPSSAPRGSESCRDHGWRPIRSSRHSASSPARTTAPRGAAGRSVAAATAAVIAHTRQPSVSIDCEWRRHHLPPRRPARVWTRFRSAIDYS